MHWWQVAHIRLVDARRHLAAAIGQAPALGAMLLAGVLAAGFLTLSLHRTLVGIPPTLMPEVLNILIRLIVTTTILSAVFVDPRSLVPRGLPLTLPVAEGSLLAGGALPVLLGVSGMGAAILAPALLALADRGMLPQPALWIDLPGGLILLGSAWWLALVLSLASGRWQLLALLGLGSALWLLLPTPWLNIFAPSARTLAGLSLLAVFDLLAWRWLLAHFSWSALREREANASPLGFRRPFRPGRLALLSLEARLLLRDRRGWLNLAITVGALWLMVGALVWLPVLTEQGTDARIRGLLSGARYMLSALYLGTLLLAAGLLRARGLYLPAEVWRRSLPVRTSDAVLSKGLVQIGATCLCWLLFAGGLFGLIGIPLEQATAGLAATAPFALAACSLAYAWGTIAPLQDETSVQGLLHIILFSLAGAGLYQAGDQINRMVGHNFAPALAGFGFSLLFLALAVAAEGWRRRHAP